MSVGKIPVRGATNSVLQASPGAGGNHHKPANNSYTCSNKSVVQHVTRKEKWPDLNKRAVNSKFMIKNEEWLVQVVHPIFHKKIITILVLHQKPMAFADTN